MKDTWRYWVGGGIHGFNGYHDFKCLKVYWAYRTHVLECMYLLGHPDIKISMEKIEWINNEPYQEKKIVFDPLEYCFYPASMYMTKDELASYKKMLSERQSVREPQHISWVKLAPLRK